MTTISLKTEPTGARKPDALVIGIAKTERGPVVVKGSADAVKGVRGLAQTLSNLGATGAPDEVVKLPAPSGVGAEVLVAVGLGDESRTYGLEKLRRAAGSAARALAGSRSVVLALPSGTPDEVEAVAQGALLGAYTFSRYRSTSKNGHKPGVAAFVLTSPLGKDKAAKAAFAHAQTVTQAVNWCRDLVNTPPSDLHPKEFAEAALAAADGLPLDVTVLDDRALKRGGYGGILGVGQGSANPPRLVRIAYRSPGATKHLALVGKGITFDSGGISIKPAQGMEAMKSDMGGAAAVIAAVTAVARLGLDVNVTGWAPMAENMPSGNAQRPSDVLTIYGGRTVEVLNTDAEGRLILADGIVRAGEEDPDVLVDAATLTGAQLIALGNRTSAIMSNDDSLRAKVFDASQRAGEQMWQMPLPEELRKPLDSAVADIANIGDRMGGMLSAGVFLKEFVKDGLPWAHLDIAGPAYNDSQPYGYLTKGGTGAAVRTLVQVAEDLAAGVI